MRFYSPSSKFEVQSSRMNVGIQQSWRHAKTECNLKQCIEDGEDQRERQWRDKVGQTRVRLETATLNTHISRCDIMRHRWWCLLHLHAYAWPITDEEAVRWLVADKWLVAGQRAMESEPWPWDAYWWIACRYILTFPVRIMQTIII